jgi:hypothetical protein
LSTRDNISSVCFYKSLRNSCWSEVCPRSVPILPPFPVIRPNLGAGSLTRLPDCHIVNFELGRAGCPTPPESALPPFTGGLRGASTSGRGGACPALLSAVPGWNKREFGRSPRYQPGRDYSAKKIELSAVPGWDERDFGNDQRHQPGRNWSQVPSSAGLESYYMII